MAEPRSGGHCHQLRTAGVLVRRRGTLEDRARPSRHPPAGALTASRQVPILLVCSRGKALPPNPHSMFLTLNSSAPFYTTPNSNRSACRDCF